MKIAVIGGSGLIGSRLAGTLRTGGHEVLAASPSTGVNTITGEGLAGALSGADVVIDVSNSPSFEETAVMNFFKTSTTNMLSAEKESGVKHHLVLSVVGTDLLQQSGYFRAKLVQEDLIKVSGVPYTIVRGTQFFEFLSGIADSLTVKNAVRVPKALFQPMSADDVARIISEIAVAAPANGIVEIAGPAPFAMDAPIRRVWETRDDVRAIVVDPDARYFGAPLAERTLVPAGAAQLGEIRFEDWLRNDSQRPARMSA